MKMPSELVIRVSQEGLADLAALVARMEAAAERMERATGGAEKASSVAPPLPHWVPRLEDCVFRLRGWCRRDLDAQAVGDTDGLPVCPGWCQYNHASSSRAVEPVESILPTKVPPAYQASRPLPWWETEHARVEEFREAIRRAEAAGEPVPEAWRMIARRTAARELADVLKIVCAGLVQSAAEAAHPAPAEDPPARAVEHVVANVAYGDSLVTEEAIHRRVADVVAEARGAGTSDDSPASPGGPAPGTGGAK